MTTIIELREAKDYDRDTYGITHRSAFVYDVTGPRLHNRHFPHRVTVWNNTVRPNTKPDEWSEYSGRPGAGRYLDPFRKGTDDEITITLGAESFGITDNGTNTGTFASGQVYAPETLQVNEFVVLKYPDGHHSDPYLIKTRPLTDPVLVPVGKDA